MPFLINKTARLITVKHRKDGNVHTLCLNPGANDVDSAQLKHFDGCDYIEGLKSDGKLSLAQKLGTDADGSLAGKAKVSTDKAPKAK